MNNRLIGLCAIITLSACAQQTHAPKTEPVEKNPDVTVQAVEKPTVIPTPDEYNSSRYSHYSLLISIEGGEVNFYNVDGYSDYIPITFTLKTHETKTIPLKKSGENFFDSKTSLTASYENGVLSLDIDPGPYAQHYNETSALHLEFTQAWLKGKTYHGISTHGKAGLNNATVKLHLLSQEF